MFHVFATATAITPPSRVHVHFRYSNEEVTLAEAVHQFTDFASAETLKHVFDVAVSYCRTPLVSLSTSRAQPRIHGVAGVQVHCGFKESKSGALKYPEVQQRFGVVQVCALPCPGVCGGLCFSMAHLCDLV